MEQIDSQQWAAIHLGLLFLITFALLAMVYALSGSSRPPAGLGLYTVYFMAALLGWLTYALQRAADVPMSVDVPSVAAIINGYLLFLAAGQRAGASGGRLPLGVFCLGACLSFFFVRPDSLYLVQIAAVGVFFTAAGALAALRARRAHNSGDLIVAGAGLIMLVCAPLALYRALAQGDAAAAHTMAFGAQSAAYVLVCVGFLASIAIEYQQHLSLVAVEDPLTRLYNRRGLEGALSVTLARAAREQLPCSAILLDVDRLKQINDNFGHETGDRVLQQIAHHLIRTSRASDAVGRTDGEEFLLILPETDLEAARAVAERICQAVGSRPMVVDRQQIPISVSIGVASAVGTTSLDWLAQQADRALHLAKRGGGNRVAAVENRPLRLSTMPENG